MHYKIEGFIENKIKDPVRMFFIKIMFPWYDYSYLLNMMSMWSKIASEKHKAIGITKNSDKTSKELLIFSELCKRISDSTAEEEGWKTLDGKDVILDFRIPDSLRMITIKRPDVERSVKQTRMHHDFYIRYFLKMIKKIEHWWD